LSAGVHREGEAPKAGRGFHLYFAVRDAADIPRFGKTLVKRLWLAGHGFIAVSSAGSFLVRSVIDGAVFDGERLDFVGKPAVGPGLAYTPPEATYHAGGWLDTRSLPDLDETEEQQLAALIAQAKQAREADRRAQRARWEETHVRAMVGRGVPEPEARAQTRQIPADGKPGDLYRDWPLVFATLGFATVGDVLANPARYDGAALADPLEGVDYGRTTAKFFANVGGKPCIHSHAHGGARYFLKATAGPEPRQEAPPFDADYYAQLAESDGAAWVPPQADGPTPRPDALQALAPAGGGADDEGAWGEPVLFSAKNETPDIPPESLPGVFGEYAAALTESLQTPPALAVATIAAVLSTALARKATIGPWGDDAYAEPLNVWTLAVAESGERKSQILGRCARPLVYWEKERTRQEKAGIEEAAALRKVGEKRAERLEADAAKEDDPARREALAKEAAGLRAGLPDEQFPTQIFTGDATPEAAQELLARTGGRMAFLSDEAGLLLVMAGVYGGGEVVLDVFLQGYSGNDVRVNRRCRSAIIERPAVTLGLSIQPGILADFPQAAKRKFRASGLFARFFPVYPRSNIGRRDVRRRAAVADALQRAYDRAVMDLLDFEPPGGEPVRLSLDAAALALWQDFFQDIEAGQAEGGEYQDIRDWAAKLPGGVLRLAGLFHLAEHGPGGAGRAVGVETMAGAVKLGLRLIGHARAVFGLVGADKTTDDAKAVWGWIEQNRLPGFLRSDAHHKFNSRFGKVQDLEAALDVLKGRELLRGPYKSKSPKGGRPTVGYRVNPAALG
jgi:putative DNA primase/helicase